MSKEIVRQHHVTALASVGYLRPKSGGLLSSQPASPTHVAQLCYGDGVATTTVRLDPEEERALDELASKHGGRSNALRVGLKLLAAEAHRQTALADLLADWDRESGPVSDDDVRAMSERYGLAP